MHLICGECGALLLDTGYGIGNLKSVIEQLTDKPVSVFNTHWHGDHTGGNSQFENVYMHEFDIPYWKESLSCEAGRMLPTTMELKNAEPHGTRTIFYLPKEAINETGKKTSEGDGV